MSSKLKNKFLDIIGDIKYYKYPMFIVYCPNTYRVKGEHYLEVSKIIKPGDILLRGYSDYLDGLFIPGDYSHGALYVGDNQIIHAISDGVQYQNLIDFMRCDRIMVFRPNCSEEVISNAIQFCKNCVENKAKYDFDFKDGNDAYYCFELVVSAYKSLGVEKKRVKRFWGLYDKELYIAESFITNKSFEKIYEYNP